MSKKSIVFLFLWIASSVTFGQNLEPQPIPCLLISKFDVNGFSGIFESQNCIISEEHNGSVKINGQEDVVMKAGEEIILKPETSIQNGGQLHAYIEKSPINVVWYEPEGTVGVANRFEKLELGLRLPESYMARIDSFTHDGLIQDPLNPFDSTSIDFWAEFEYNLNGNWIGPIRVNGFYYKEFVRVINDPSDTSIQSQYWVEDTTMFPLRIRFSPVATGEWRVKFFANVPSDQVQFSSYYINFICVDNGGKPYVEVGENNKFLVSGGETFFPVGQNLRWPYYFRSPEDAWPFPPYAYIRYHERMTELKNRGGNLFRLLIAPWNLDIEFEELGNYSDRMNFAWELDNIIDKADSLDLRILLNLQVHYPYEIPNPFGFHKWDYPGQNDPRIANCAIHVDQNGNPDDPGNPYYNELGLNNISDFFSDPIAKRYYKARLRYMSARWGYSTNIAVMELFSEINNAGNIHDKILSIIDPCDPNRIGVGCYKTNCNGESDENPYTDNMNYPNFPAIVGLWQHEMCGYLKGIGTRQLLGVNYTGEPNLNEDGGFFSNNVDVVSWNRYRPSTTTGLDINLDINRYRNAFQIEKPFIHSEIGNGLCDDEVTYFLNLWSSAFSGSYGTAINWYEDDSTYWNNLANIQTFFGNINLSAEDWEANYDRRNDSRAYTQYLKEEVGKKRAIGVIINETYNWYTSGSCVEERPANNVDTLETIVNEPFNRLRLSGMGFWGTNYITEYFDARNLNPIGWSMASTAIDGSLILGHPDLEVFGTNAHPIVVFRTRRVGQPSFYNPSQSGNEVFENDFTLFEHVGRIEEYSQDYPKSQNDSRSEDILIAPNPAKELIRISAPLTSLGEQWRIVDSKGSEVISGMTTDQHWELDISHLKSGIFYFIVGSGDESFVSKFIVLK